MSSASKTKFSLGKFKGGGGRISKNVSTADFPKELKFELTSNFMKK